MTYIHNNAVINNVKIDTYQKKWIDLFAYNESTSLFALDSSSYAWSWGLNSSGELGDGTTNSRSSPVSVLGGRKWIKIVTADNRTLGLDISSNVWGWGSNGSGQLGDNTLISKSSPVSVVGGRKFIDIGFFSTSASLALDASSFLWGWSGNVGNNTLGVYSSPVSVVGDRRWKKFPKHARHAKQSLLLDESGKIFSWGNNSTGQLGDGTLTTRYSPVSVFGTAGGLQFLSVTAGFNNSFAIDTSSKIWSWGSQNNSGMLGDNTGINRSSPVSLFNTDINFKYVYVNNVNNHQYYNAFAIDTSSQLWNWGYILNTNTAYSNPLITEVLNVPVDPETFLYSTGDSGGIMGCSDTNLVYCGYGVFPVVSPVSSPTTFSAGVYFKKLVRTPGPVYTGLTEDGRIWNWGAATTGLANIVNITGKSTPAVMGPFATRSDLLGRN